MQSCFSSVTVHVKVTDVNEYAPVFVEPSYVVGVDEGRLYEEILTLQADDQDCSPKFGDICRYELITKDQVSTVSQMLTVGPILEAKLYLVLI